MHGVKVWLGAVLCGCWMLSAAEVLPTEIKGQTLSINGNATKFDQKNWNESERTWRTLGEMLKSALPGANEAGQRPPSVLKLTLDEQAPWGAAKSLLMATSALGVPKAEIVHAGQSFSLKLPGADPKEGQVVSFPIQADGKTAKGGSTHEVNDKLVKGLVAQLPNATVNVTAEPTVPAHHVFSAIQTLQRNGAKKVAFMPLVKATEHEKAQRQEASDAVDRAFGGALGM
jgi:biopolymer transport protein ExbD